MEKPALMRSKALCGASFMMVATKPFCHTPENGTGDVEKNGMRSMAIEILDVDLGPYKRFISGLIISGHSRVVLL
jgi:hypothetical protein